MVIYIFLGRKEFNQVRVNDLDMAKGVFGCNLEASDSVQNPLIRSDFACTASKI